ncbi:hypothetical protein Q8W14_22245 [Photobacterium damselae subsp. piscicida]|nr:hypothetical protein [Photobacterium damselae subsp. piscicida]MDP2568234.1 hypothetical protein [Photobacterium damselae subsp. piscicida]MDP2570292.1 hypothetical protein [Photobacterium damselae subsp. piscicida]
MRKETEVSLYYAEEVGELSPKLIVKSIVQIRAVEKLMKDMDVEYEPATFPEEWENMIISMRAA